MEVKWEELTDEQKEQLMQRAEEEKKQKSAVIQEERNRYKQMAESTVEDIFEKLAKASAYLSQLKRDAYDSLFALVEIKKEVYQTTKKNKSHTFTNNASDKSITIGTQEIMRWDGTEQEGIELIDTYLQEKVTDDDMKALLTEVLKRDNEGKLDAKRVMSLAKLKERITDARFQEGVEILLSAYKPAETAIYVDVRERTGDTRKWKGVPLSFASVEAAITK